MKKLLTLLVALAMVLSFTACNKAPEEVTVDEFRTFDAETYSTDCTTLYNAALGDFYSAYQEAKKVENVSERYALMAVAEAKLMEASVLLPLYTSGGNYAVNRVVPWTAPSALWGYDADRVSNLLVCTEFITKEDREALRTMYNELKGTGTYRAKATEYLTGKGYTLKDSYTTTFTELPQTWDVLATSRAADADYIIDTFDGLMEYDCEGVQQFKLADSLEVSEDGKTYTFHIREGVKWVDSQGREIADVTADDFVAGFQHMMDTMGGLEYLVEGVIVGASDYIYGTDKDMSKVGVKALDANTLVYELEQPTSYFITMIAYGNFAPMCRSFYESLGGKFGTEYTSEGLRYGTSYETIAYNGPMLISSATAENSIVYVANPTYWDAANKSLKSVTYLFNDGTDQTKAYKDAVAGTIDGSGLNTEAMVLAKQDGNFDKYGFVTTTIATTYVSFYNLNRYQFANINDTNTVKSSQTANDANRTYNAMQNVHFRRALSFAYDRGASRAQRVGEELKNNALRNSYTPYNFVSLLEETTIKINGKDTTYPAGTYYGKIMQDQLNADGVPITVYDESQPNGGDGFDGWYNADNAAKEMDQAVKELAAKGFTIDAEHPIYVDIPYYSTNNQFALAANSYKQSVEAALGGKVIMNLVPCETAAEWYYAGYYTDYGYEANYDIYDLSGWGPDYGDPSTYLDTMLPDGAGYMVKCLGLW